MDLIVGEKHEEITNEENFIKKTFFTRTCYKYCAIKDDLCKCNCSRIDHSEEEKEQNKWSYENNTCLRKCIYHGRIKFPVCDDLCPDHKFIRFNVIGNKAEKNLQLSSIVEAAYTLIDEYWKISKPKLIISVIGGFKRMDLSNQQKKNFKQGLIDIMKKDRTMIIAGGFNVGIHKLVSETVREFRIYHESEDTKVHLIGICTWGVVWKNDVLGPREEGLLKNIKSQFYYPNGISNQKGKVALDPNYDCLLLCDDGTERTYDKEVDFRSKFEKYAEHEAKSFTVQILCEGGYRAVYRAHETLENKISIVVLKGSGRAADLISDVIGLKKLNLQRNIREILDEYKSLLNVQDKDIPSLMESLMDMHEKYSHQIVIYDMFDPSMKFGKMIVKAIILGQTGRSLEDTLRLTIRFNCADIALTEIFSHSDYSKMDGEFIKKKFIEVLKEDKYEFVVAFLENDMEIANVVTKETLISLYVESLDIKKCPYADLLNDLISKKDIQTNELHFIGKIIPILSGNILHNNYNENTRKSTDPFVTQDLFLWALFSGRIELAEIFWRFGKDHISSALIGSTILKNMAQYILKRGDSELEKKLSDASAKFEQLAINILTKAYSKSREKTFTILIRELKTWNEMTCLRIALSGNLLEFLSQSACRSYTTQVWMGGLSPFLSIWKILISIPFSLCFMYHLIIPSFPQRILFKRPRRKQKNQYVQNPLYLIEDPDDYKPSKQYSRNEKVITFCQATKIFYSAPIVKFYINFATYMIFLVIFAYLNLVELKPRNEIKCIKDISAETFIYVYLVTFIVEEVRQIIDQGRNDLVNQLKAYFSGSCNQLDTFIILVFIISIIIRFLLSQELFMICRCMYSVCYCMFCLRTMQFYFAYEFVGPKVIMIYDMIRDIIFFLSIFALFIVSFGTLSHSMRSPNSEMNIFLIKDIMFMPYFQTYGELMLDKLFEENACNTTNCHFQQTTVIVGFAVYLLLTNILLVNLLIAMFGYTFNKIQEQSEKYWLFIRLQLVEEFYTKPILSPPLNIFYYLYKIVYKLIKLCDCRKKEKERYDNNENLLLKLLPSDENLRITGFEQICMEEAMDDTQCNLNDFLTKNLEETKEKENSSDKIQLQAENSLHVEAQDIMSSKSFQIRYDKRLEKLENNIEKLIYRGNN